MPTNIYSIKDVLLTQEKRPAKDQLSARYQTLDIFFLLAVASDSTVAARITQPANASAKNDFFQVDLNARWPSYTKVKNFRLTHYMKCKHVLYSDVLENNDIWFEKNNKHNEVNLKCLSTQDIEIVLLVNEKYVFNFIPFSRDT